MIYYIWYQLKDSIHEDIKYKSELNLNNVDYFQSLEECGLEDLVVIATFENYDDALQYLYDKNVWGKSEEENEN